MQQLVNAVRSTGSTSPVMVGGLNSASQDGQDWLTFHPVDPAHQLVASEHNYGQINYATNIAPVAEDFPVVVGEVGEMNCAHNYLDTFLPWADSHGVSYVAWAWFVGSCSAYPSLISNYEGTPTNFGVGYRDHLLANFPLP
jgi:phage-related tail fiber protein